MTHGSLFAGIGGFDLGFERAGIKTVWQVEIEAYCRRVLEKHFPHAARIADIRDCCGKQPPHRIHDCARREHLPWVDILSGGFPCQDISNAGKRAGIDGERSGLWSEYARIICELRPRYVVVENVAALLGRGMERVLGDLAESGYDAEWQSIRASDVGAPHRRERIWIIAYPQGDIRRASWDDGPEPFNRRDSFLADSERAERRPITERRDESNGHDAGRKEAPSRITQCRENVADTEEFSGELRSAARERSRGFAGGGNGVPHADEQGLSVGVDTALGAEGRYQESERLHSTGKEWWAVEPDVGRVAHGIPARVDRLRGLGNAVVPQIAEWIGRRIIEAARQPL